MAELRKLYSLDECLELSDTEDGGDVNSQILQLRRLLEHHKAVLRGEDAEDDAERGASSGSSDDENDEEARQRRRAEEEAARDAEFEGEQAREAEELEEVAGNERDEIAG